MRHQPNPLNPTRNTQVCEQLMRCVRLDQLPPTYLALALPQQSWVIKVGGEGAICSGGAV